MLEYAEYRPLYAKKMVLTRLCEQIDHEKDVDENVKAERWKVVAGVVVVPEADLNFFVPLLLFRP